jgi:hypothetical protein
VDLSVSVAFANGSYFLPAFPQISVLEGPEFQFYTYPASVLTGIAILMNF